MPYTFDASTNTIYACSSRGIKVADMYTKHMQDAGKTNPCESAEWTKGQLVIGGSAMMYTSRRSARAFYLKLLRNIMMVLFEDVFGLGCECRGWISDLTVKITN